MFLVDWFYGILASLGERPNAAVNAVARQGESTVEPEPLRRHTQAFLFCRTHRFRFCPLASAPPQPAAAYLDGWLVGVRRGGGCAVHHFIRNSWTSPRGSRQGGRFAVSGPMRSVLLSVFPDILRQSNKHARDPAWVRKSHGRGP